MYTHSKIYISKAVNSLKNKNSNLLLSNLFFKYILEYILPDPFPCICKKKSFFFNKKLN